MKNKYIRAVNGDQEKYKILRLMTIHPPRCPDCREPVTLEDDDRLIMRCNNEDCRVMWYWVDIKGKTVRDPNTGQLKITRRDKTKSDPDKKAQIDNLLMDIEQNFFDKEFDYYYP